MSVSMHNLSVENEQPDCVLPVPLSLNPNHALTLGPLSGEIKITSKSKIMREEGV